MVGRVRRPEDDKLVFPGETKNGYINAKVALTRNLYPTLETAGITRLARERPPVTWSLVAECDGGLWSFRASRAEA
jgi:hypothetical protein